jgi:hypothetical protein
MDIVLEIKADGPEADGSLATGCDVKNEWSYYSTPPYVFRQCTGTSLPLIYI